MSIVTVHGANTMYDDDEHAAVEGWPGYFVGGPTETDPQNLTELRLKVKPVGSQRWANDSYVVLGNATRAYWDGSDWQSGYAPWDSYDRVKYVAGANNSRFAYGTGPRATNLYEDVIPSGQYVETNYDQEGKPSLPITGGPGTDGRDAWTDSDVSSLPTSTYTIFWDGTHWND